jgi:hypothetical protein
VRENLLTLYAAAEQGFASALPKFVKEELEGFVNCGLLCRGFALLACPICSEQKLVAFSCKRRGFCPSCLGRRMAETSANLMEHVLPENVPLRQFVLTVPFELRARLAYDKEILGSVCRIFVDSVLGFYRRRMRDRGIRDGRSGAVSVVQRTSADLRLNPHIHTVALDGVFAPSDQGVPIFHAFPALDNRDVADLLQVVRVRILRMLSRAGVIDEDSAETLCLLDDGFAERDPALFALAHSAVTGLVPAGPEHRERIPLPIELRGSLGVTTSALCAAELGFSLHAATTARADDAEGREALVRYILRPAIAQERVQLLPNDLVRIHLRRPFRDGTFAVDLDPLSLLSRLAASIPPPFFNVVRYAGVLAPASKLRPLVVPPLPSQPPIREEDLSPCSDCATPHDTPITHRSGYRPWRELLMRTFRIDVEKCDRCGDRVKLRALVLAVPSIDRRAS